MPTVKISIPNDYGSEEDQAAAILDCYSGDQDAALSDECRACYDALASSASAAGLKFNRGTDFGAEWSGTATQCAEVRRLAPPWAYISSSGD